ncbi:triacylglycerol lipase [Actinomycetospora sp. TBRC 11914]|uniref:esterase/lipase family protein n=1 Tax=Actinomycetospora sp. TBRC 11914 TaxID=2729387 RepID=UPI00145F92A8|nr:alpha/beta hydrolase [Actinomycetospora sp. TBRC 11914]NMO91568.1 alpha/beta hydrolase [Actinomycetospora sp. TBRC 11914]
MGVPMWWNTLIGQGLEHVGRATVGLTGLRHRSVGVDEAVDDPGSGPVVLIGGFGETAPCLAPMTNWLTRVGYDARAYTLGAGMGCSQRTTVSLVRRVRALAEEAGEPVRVVGHSRGGQLARAVGAEAPESVSHVVTIGTPLDMSGTTPAMAAMLWGFAAAGTMGVPGLYRLGCLTVGACCAGFREALRAPWPAQVALTSIYSPTDAAVSWRACHVPGARNVEVASGHVAQLTAAQVQRAVAAALVAAPAPGTAAA